MTLSKLYEMGLIGDNTKVIIRVCDFHVVASGNWYNDDVIKYAHLTIESFTWQNNEKIYVDLL